MRISDCSSDVCSSDLPTPRPAKSATTTRMIGSMEIPPSERKANLKQAPPPLKPLRDPRSEKPVHHEHTCRRRRHVHRPDRSEVLREGKERARPCRSRGSRSHKKKKE